MNVEKENKKIKVTKNGPYVISGRVPLAKEVIVADANGDSVGYRKKQKFDCPDQYALCHCGASANKPFRDGCHIDEKFSDGDPSLG